jgi:hypothetical protein
VPCGLDPANPSACKIGNISISPSGKYVDVKFSSSDPVTQDMHRIFEVDPMTLELRPHLMDAAALRCDTFQSRNDGWTFPLKHADMALDPFDNNEDVIIGGRSCPGSSLGHVVMVRLRDGKVTSLTNPSNEPSFQHASARNLDRPGWVYVGFYKADGMKFNDEIVAVKMDGSGQLERWSHKRSASSGCYRCESHPVPSRDGKRVLFASNWSTDCGGLCGPSSDIKDYVVSLPAGPVSAGNPKPLLPACRSSWPGSRRARRCHAARCASRSGKPGASTLTWSTPRGGWCARATWAPSKRGRTTSRSSAAG